MLAGAAVKGRLVVSFVNEQGMLEAGLDYGGLVKEFLEQVATTHCTPTLTLSLHVFPVAPTKERAQGSPRNER